MTGVTTNAELRLPRALCLPLVLVHLVSSALSHEHAAGVALGGGPGPSGPPHLHAAHLPFWPFGPHDHEADDEDDDHDDACYTAAGGILPGVTRPAPAASAGAPASPPATCWAVLDP